MSDHIRATVAILTYNGETYLERILQQVFAQRLSEPFEVLVVDSGSTDSTLNIVARYPEVRLHSIPNSEFGHGKTRNLAAQLAQGDFVAFLTHDAIPIGDSWLSELLDPFSLSPRIVGVVGKQVPRPRCFPLLKYEIQGVFDRLGPDIGTTLYYKAPFVRDDSMLSVLGFYSDVNSAARREFLVETLPYRDVPYAEDQLFGKDLIEAGYIKVYAGRAAVEHSNDLTRAEYGKRIFDETVGLRRIGFPVSPLSRGDQWRLTLRGIIGDTLRLMRDPAYTWKRRLFWLAINPSYQVRKWHTYRRSSLVDLDDESAVARHSLEHSKKS